MKKQLLAAALVALTVSSGPASAAWTETQKTAAQNTGSNSLASISINVSQNHLLLVLGAVKGNTTGSITAADGAANSYTVYSCQQSTNSSYAFIAWALTSTALSAQAVTVSFSGTAAGITYAIWDITGQQASAPEDVAARACNSSTSNTTTPTVTSMAPAHTNDLFASVWGIFTTASGATYATSGSWLPSGGYGTGNTTLGAISDYLEASGSGAQTNSPTTNSKTYAMPVMAFIQNGAAAVLSCRRSLLGVGC